MEPYRTSFFFGYVNADGVAATTWTENRVDAQVLMLQKLL